MCRRDYRTLLAVMACRKNQARKGRVCASVDRCDALPGSQGRGAAGRPRHFQNGMTLCRPFFFLGLLDDPEAAPLFEELELLLALGADPAFSTSFTWAGGGRACPRSAAASSLSSFESEAGFGFNSFGSATAGGAAERSGDGVSERGAAAFGAGGADPSLGISTSMDLLPPPEGPIMAWVAAFTTSVALIPLGSTSVGSPTFVACATSGCLLKPLNTWLTMPGVRRLSSSAVFCAIAAGVGVGIGRCKAARRFFASSTRSITG